MRAKIGLSLLLIAVLLAGCAPEPVPTPDPREPPAWVTVHPTVTAVVLATPTPITLPTPWLGDRPAIYDGDGLQVGYPWLHATFGKVTWQPASSPAAPYLEALRACQGDCPAAVVVAAKRTDGAPAANIAVVWSWPDAPELPEELQACGITRGIWGSTNAEGLVGFAMGGGAYYYPPAGGPHSLWIPGGACVFGLGMLGETNHEHVDADFTLSDVEGVATDWGFPREALVYELTIDGRQVTVVAWPGEGVEP